MTGGREYAVIKKNAPRPVLLFVVNEAYFFLSHRRRLATLAAEEQFDVHVAAPVHHTWAPPDFELDHLHRDLGVTVHAIPMSRRGQNPVQEFVTLVALLVLFVRLRPEIVHLITIKPVVYGAIAARILGVSGMIVSVTGLGSVFSSSGPLAAARRWIVSGLLRFGLQHRNSMAIVQNHGDLSVLIDDGIAVPERVVLIPGSGVDLKHFTEKLEPDLDVPRVLFASRLLWDKGVGDFAEAARRIREQDPMLAEFVLVGDTHDDVPGAVRSDVIGQWVGAGTLAWLGRRDDIHDLIASANLICLPTRYGEGVPKILIEAAATGRAIIASDIAGCREIVSDGENGLLVAPGDVDALVASILELLSQPERRKRMAARGARRAAEMFDVESVAQKTVSLYQRVCDNCRP